MTVPSTIEGNQEGAPRINVQEAVRIRDPSIPRESSSGRDSAMNGGGLG
jgi:hypothetical protein